MKTRLTLLFLLVAFTTNLLAQDTLRVAIKESPPFTIKENGEWKGLSVDLVNRIKDKLNYKIEYHELTGSYNEVINDMNHNKYDLFVASTTITGDRLSKVDFTQPFFVGSISVATNIDTDKTFWKAFFTWKFMKSLLWLLLIIFICGLIFWWFEREKNDKIDKGWKGIFEGAFFASFTMTSF
jgi:polar amino acid transport system substrate-binding protein